MQGHRNNFADNDINFIVMVRIGVTFDIKRSLLMKMWWCFLKAAYQHPAFSNAIQKS